MIIIWTTMGVLGCILVAKNKAYLANILWSISNIGMIVYNYNLAEYEMCFMFIIYWIIAVYGVYNLRDKNV